MLDDFFAPFMLKIHIDIWRLMALFRNKARKQQFVFCRINASDAQHITHGGVGGRATALAQNAFVLGHAHNVMDGEKIPRIVQLFNEVKFFLQHRFNFLWNALRIALCGVRPS